MDIAAAKAGLEAAVIRHEVPGAVAVVGERGIRALSHTRVDERAGLPKGSTSNWFRTRSALLAGVVSHIAESERGDFGAGPPSLSTSDEMTRAFTAMVEVETAKALCVPCPLRDTCLAGALERREPWGVWGGQLVVAGVVVPRKRPRGRPRKVDLAA